MSEVIVRASVFENKYIHLQIISGSDIVFFYTEDNEYILYIGPYNGKYLYSNDEYKTIVDGSMYRMCLGITFHAILTTLCDFIEGSFVLRPLSEDFMSTHGSGDESWEWFEIANDSGFFRMSLIDIYTYFVQRPKSLQSILRCISIDVVQALLRSLDINFSEITAPNKNIASSLRILKDITSIKAENV